MNWGPVTGPTLALICALLAVYVAMLFLGVASGRGKFGRKAREAEELDQTIAQRRNELEELNERLERRSGAERRASAVIEEAQTIRADHEALDRMKAELQEFEAQELRRLDDLETRRAAALARLEATEREAIKTDVQFGGSDDEWAEKIRKRKEELAALEENTADARAELVATRAEKRQCEEEARRAKEREEGARAEWDAYQAKLENLKGSDQARILEAFEEKFDAANAELAETERCVREKARELERLEDAAGALEKADVDGTKMELQRLRDALEAEKAALQDAQEAATEAERRRGDAEEEAKHAEERRTEAEEAVRRAKEQFETITTATEAISGASVSFDPGTLAVKIEEMPSTKTDLNVRLGAFAEAPPCLDTEGSGALADQAEAEDERSRLERFRRELMDSQLYYHERVVKAFHTSLKVNDLAPLTVLSGLSGTGKSQLPREYARSFGIHFLHVPVEPGWDSPQDLLGFYDFVAERYRPTDRARALARFDPQFAHRRGLIEDPGRNPWGDRMLLILLDEMNLARTEYYFSEFLSRLEMRGARNADGENGTVRDDAAIAIELPYKEGETPETLYVPHNVLWVGTLNEDETTQALSDKVLDRANSIKFAPPKAKTIVEHADPPSRAREQASGHLGFREWLNWSETHHARGAANREEHDAIMETLVEIMQSADRGFGYRIAQSISAYVARYPDPERWKDAIVDQINMRLLPKLSGTELTASSEALGKLQKLCRDQLDDPEFAEAVKLAQNHAQLSQIFSWPGYTYE